MSCRVLPAPRLLGATTPNLFPNQSIEEAARALQSQLQGKPWFNLVGIGESDGRPAIYVYVRKLRVPELESLRGGWNDFPVVIKKSSAPRPLNY